MKPVSTRLRHVSAKDIQTIEDFLSRLGFRVQIYSVNYVKNRWYLIFVPPDESGIDIKSVDLD